MGALARVSYNSGTNRLKVEIDGANTDRFVECFDTELPHGQFIAGSHIALSATTGQLADNHDILAVDTASLSHEFVNDDEAQSFLFRDIAVLETKIQRLPGGPETLTLMKLWRKEQEKRFNHLHHQFEHEIEFLRDSMTVMIKKIKKAEEADAARITKLEEAATLAAKQNIASEIDNVKRELSSEFSSRRENDITRSRHHTLTKLQELESNLHDKINKKITSEGLTGRRYFLEGLFTYSIDHDFYRRRHCVQEIQTNLRSRSSTMMFHRNQQFFFSQCFLIRCHDIAFTIQFCIENT